MRYALTISCMFFFSVTATAQTFGSSTSDSTVVNTEYLSPAKSRHHKGDTLIYYEVLHLKDIDYRQRKLVVFAKAVVTTRRSEARLKIRYLLKRERDYLGKIFFSRVDVIEADQTDMTTTRCLSELEKKYKGVSIWTILDANQFFQ